MVTRKLFGIDVTCALAWTHDGTRLEIYVDGAEPDHAKDFHEWMQWSDQISIKEPQEQQSLTLL